MKSIFVALGLTGLMIAVLLIRTASKADHLLNDGSGNRLD